MLWALHGNFLLDFEFYFSPPLVTAMTDFYKLWYSISMHELSDKKKMVFLHGIPTCCSAVRIAPFSNRLSQQVPSYVQGLRCLTNFEALRFAEPIRSLADKMVQRMVEKSSQDGGKYVSVHLRFEKVLSHLIFFIHMHISNRHSLINRPIFLSKFKRIWLHFLAVNMMVERKRNGKWILLVKKVGEVNLGEKVELLDLVQIA